MSNGKLIIILLVAGWIKKILLHKINFLMEISVSNWIYVIRQKKVDLKGAIGADKSNLAAKSYLVRLKAEVDKIDVDTLKADLADLSKQSNVVDNDVVKKTMYDKLVTKVNAIVTSGFVLKTKYDADKLVLEKKISGAVKKIPDISGFVNKKRIIMLK